jgi:hypothetical protein
LIGVPGTSPSRDAGPGWLSFVLSPSAAASISPAAMSFLMVSTGARSLSSSPAGADAGELEGLKGGCRASVPGQSAKATAARMRVVGRSLTLRTACVLRLGQTAPRSARSPVLPRTWAAGRLPVSQPHGLEEPLGSDAVALLQRDDGADPVGVVAPRPGGRRGDDLGTAHDVVASTSVAADGVRRCQQARADVAGVRKCFEAGTPISGSLGLATGGLTSVPVREGGFEPPRPFGHWHLKPARLPFRHSRK